EADPEQQQAGKRAAGESPPARAPERPQSADDERHARNREGKGDDREPGHPAADRDGVGSSSRASATACRQRVSSPTASNSSSASRARKSDSRSGPASLIARASSAYNRSRASDGILVTWRTPLVGAGRCRRRG